MGEGSERHFTIGCKARHIVGADHHRHSSEEESDHNELTVRISGIENNIGHGWLIDATVETRTVTFKDDTGAEEN